MGKPDDIPQDLWDHVERAVVPMDIIGSVAGTRTVCNCCYAIMAAKADEREAIATHIEAISDALYEKADAADNEAGERGPGRDDAFAAWMVANIVAEIRKRGEG